MSGTENNPGVFENKIIKAPFTPQQVAGLNEWQMCGHVHEFTCGNRDQPGHEIDYALFATVRGWICPVCDYTQDWAHDFMAQGAPPNPFSDFEDHDRAQQIAIRVCESIVGTGKFALIDIHVAKKAILEFSTGIRAELAMALDAAAKGEAGRQLGNALEECQKQNSEFRQQIDWSKENSPRDGNWMDRLGCCKVCDGEIPYGHTDECDVHKLDMQIANLQHLLRQLLYARNVAGTKIVDELARWHVEDLHEKFINALK